MSRKYHNNLATELRQAGASESEANELVALAISLKQLKNPKDLAVKPASQDQRQFSRRTLIPVGIPLITGLVLGMVLVILSQTVLPGSVLYPIQKLSDNVAMSINSDYRGTVMMKRAQEVKQLVAQHASSNLVLATLADYRVEASAYRLISAHYAVFEFCKSNLQQAATTAPNPERQAIDKTLLSLQNV